MSTPNDRDVREEIKIAIFWRNLIGDFEYIKFDPNDMMRWYDALELRGPVEIRHVLRERYATRPISAVLGIVSHAPHPPTWLVREWLAFYEQQVSAAPVWWTAGGFLLLCLLVFPFMQSCASLRPVSPYAMNPPSGQPQFSPNQMPSGSLLATNKAPPNPYQPGATGPRSTGISGAATGVSPASGSTGGVNGGISAGATSAAPAVGTSQP